MMPPDALRLPDARRALAQGLGRLLAALDRAMAPARGRASARLGAALSEHLRRDLGIEGDPLL